MTMNPDLPQRQGLYDPSFEHDSCGVNFIANLKGQKSHKIVSSAIGALCQLQHRGALGSEENTGDGAGILIQVPDKFFREVVDFELPAQGQFVTGIAFMPQDPSEYNQAVSSVEIIAEEIGFSILGWRETPVDSSNLGSGAVGTMPKFTQIFLTYRNDDGHYLSGIDLDRKAYILRKRCQHEIQFERADVAGEGMGGMSRRHSGVYFPSLSSRTFVYKGMLTTPQLGEFFLDLSDERVESALPLFTQGFQQILFRRGHLRIHIGSSLTMEK